MGFYKEADVDLLPELFKLRITAWHSQRSFRYTPLKFTQITGLVTDTLVLRYKGDRFTQLSEHTR